jgi:lysophospholipase L1-like esterase
MRRVDRGSEQNMTHHVLAPVAAFITQVESFTILTPILQKRVLDACPQQPKHGRRQSRREFRVYRCLVALASLFAVYSYAGASDSALVPGTNVSVADFGAVPNDEKNDAPALREAMEFAKGHPGIVLYFPPGTYDFRDDKAVQLMEDAMNGKFGVNPERTIFQAYYPYVRGLDFRGISGLTIEAQAATLLCEGWMEPVSVDQATNVTIRGLTIDYKRKPYSAGTIVAKGDDYFDAVIEDQYPIRPSMPVPRVMYWDPKALRLLGNGDAKRVEIIAPQTVRIHVQPKMMAIIDEGIQIALPHSMHFRPAILIQHADNIRLDGVTIHSQPGMGILGHHSGNVVLSRVNVVPAPGSFVSTTTDATHFTSSTGEIRIENSQFAGHGDDALNVHNYYYSIAAAKRRGHYSLTVPVNVHAGVLDYPDVGDSLDLVSAGSLEPVKSVVVKSVAPNPQQMRTEVEIDGDLPEDLSQYYLINTTRLPKVEIVGNSFLSHRARSILVKTRNVLIERNLFIGTVGTAIHIAAEGSWHEGVPSANVVIRDNRILGGGVGDGTVAGASAIAVNIDSKESSTVPLHRGLLIEGNTIVAEGAYRCIFLSRVEGVEIRHNEVSGCLIPISAEYSRHVAVHDNTIVADRNSATIPVPQSGMEARHAEKVALVRKHRYDLLMIGDSITHGFENPAFASVWQQFYAPRNALNLGYSGARTENILWNLTHGELDNQSPKVITLLIGTNNSDDANYLVVHTAKQIAAGTAAIVKLLREKAPDAKILLLRIFPRSIVYQGPDGSERGSAQRRTATNLQAGDLVASLADNDHVFYLDVNSVFLRPDGSIDPQLMPDLLHPSPAGALAWARAMEPQLAKLFGDTPRTNEALSGNKECQSTRPCHADGGH